MWNNHLIICWHLIKSQKSNQWLTHCSLGSVLASCLGCPYSISSHLSWVTLALGSLTREQLFPQGTYLHPRCPLITGQCWFQSHCPHWLELGRQSLSWRVVVKLSGRKFEMSPLPFHLFSVLSLWKTLLFNFMHFSSSWIHQRAKPNSARKDFCFVSKQRELSI